MSESHEVGKAAEEIAAKYLENQNFRILERNWRFGNDEIDIIAKKEGQIVFVEVKSRRTSYFGEPEIFVNKRKQQFLIRGANAYIQKEDIQDEARFDIISILFKGTDYVVKHIDDAFYPTL